MQFTNFLRSIFSLRRQDEGQDPLVRDLLFLAMPVIGQSLFRTLLFFVDRTFLGHFSSDALASMQISGAFVFSLLSIIGAFTVGAIAVIGRMIGENDSKNAAASLRAAN